MLSFLLNFPFTLIGVILAAISLPKSVKFKSGVFIFRVKKLWWGVGYLKGFRAATLGNVVILGPNTLPGDLEHEMVHVDQHRRAPFIHPFLYLLETMKYGYENNRFEKEAYAIAGEYHAKARNADKDKVK